MHRCVRAGAFLLAILFVATLPRLTARPSAQATAAKIPRTADGKPNLQGIWQARNRASYDLEDHHARYQMPPGKGVVEGGAIPYQDWAKKKRDENFANRVKEDPFLKCHMPGVPRIMYLEYPFQILQSKDHVTMQFEWGQVYRLIYTNGSKPVEGIEFFMGDSRGRWEADTLVVTVTNFNDRTWFDGAGNFHSTDLKVTERYSMSDPDTIRYEATISDPKVFTRDWKISMPLYRNKDTDRLLEYQCNAEAEEASGAFERLPKTWYPK